MVMAKLMASSSVAETWWVVRVMVAVAVAVLAMVVGWLAGWLVERGRGIPSYLSRRCTAAGSFRPSWASHPFEVVGRGGKEGWVGGMVVLPVR